MHEEISQISICTQRDIDEKISEVVLVHPLTHNKAELEKPSRLLQTKKWRMIHSTPFYKRISAKARALIFRHAKQWVPADRKTPEAKLKTVLALLLVQGNLRHFFLDSPLRRANFLEVVKKAAHLIGYRSFTIPHSYADLSTDDLSKELTLISKTQKCLVDDPLELSMQEAALAATEYREILFHLLNHIERPPISSNLEMSDCEKSVHISVMTHYAKCKIDKIQTHDGRIQYQYTPNQVTSSIRTKENIQPGVKGAINQRVAYDTSDPNNVFLLGAYSGELTTRFHVLEQILFMLSLPPAQINLLHNAPQGSIIEEKKVFFTSLYSYNELGMIQEQKAAIHSLNGRILSIKNAEGERYIKLTLAHRNIPLNSIGRLPHPAEIQASLNDLNDASLILLSLHGFQKLSIPAPDLDRIGSLYMTLQNLDYDRDFFAYQDILLRSIDHFREIKKELIKKLEPEKDEVALLLRTLLNKKCLGMDELLYLDRLCKHLSFYHNKNCQDSINHSGCANAADKAQNAFIKIQGYPYLPKKVQPQEDLEIFKLLYSMYFFWEEPEMNLALSTGAYREKGNHDQGNYLLSSLNK